MNEITCDNVLKFDFETIRKSIFSLIDLHVDYVSIDQGQFIYLLGYYPAVYNYLSELYTFMINKVRQGTESNERLMTGRYRDLRDMFEVAMKSVKLHYDSLSRKITVLTPNYNRGD